MFVKNSVVRCFSSQSSYLKSLSLTLPYNSTIHLEAVLSILSKNNLCLSHIASQPVNSLDFTQGTCVHFSLDSPSPSSYQALVQEFLNRGFQLQEPLPLEVPWFPRSLQELTKIEQRTLSAGADLECDHPGFKDLEYRKRRQEIAEISVHHNCLSPEVPRVAYTATETDTWEVIFNVLRPLHKAHACKEYNNNFEEMVKHCGYRPRNIPQIQDINDYLTSATGFRLIPIAGLLSARDFLNFLAFRIFASTQYIRHHSVPFYTPEPDIVHELMGHAPLFADKDFADFSQEIGLASLGASEADIKKLATCYWFSIEFGILLEEDGKSKKGYGAGVLSSVDEILNAVDMKTQNRFFDPLEVCDIAYPITTLQPTYFWSRNFEEAKKMMTRYAASIQRGFSIAYDKKTNGIKVYQDVKCLSIK